MSATQQDFFLTANRVKAESITRPACEETGTGLKLPAKHDGPLSSKLAGAEIENDGTRRIQIEEAADAALKFPDRTALELSVLTGLDRHVLGKRLPDARKLGLVASTAKIYRCSISGKLAMHWRATR